MPLVLGILPYVHSPCPAPGHSRHLQPSQGYAEKELLLPRSFSELYDSVRDFLVAEEEGQKSSGRRPSVTWEEAGRTPIARRG